MIPQIQTLYPQMQTINPMSPLATSTSALNHYATSMQHSAKSLENSSKSTEYSTKSLEYSAKSKRCWDESRECATEILRFNSEAQRSNVFTITLGCASLISLYIAKVYPSVSSYAFPVCCALFITSAFPFGHAKNLNEKALHMAELEATLIKKSTKYNQKALEFADKARDCMPHMVSHYDQATLECTNGNDSVELFNYDVD